MSFHQIDELTASPNRDKESGSLKRVQSQEISNWFMWIPVFSPFQWSAIKFKQKAYPSKNLLKIVGIQFILVECYVAEQKMILELIYSFKNIKRAEK